jgi:hypothetical protein
MSWLEWVDAHGPKAAGWANVCDFNLDLGGYLCWASGWVVAEDATHLHVAGHLGNVGADPIDEQMVGLISIPKKLILRQKRLPNWRKR